MEPLKLLRAGAMAHCARHPAACAPLRSSKNVGHPVRSAAVAAEATSRLVQAATSPHVSLARTKVHVAQPIAPRKPVGFARLRWAMDCATCTLVRAPQSSEPQPEPALTAVFKAVAAKMASLLEPKPASPPTFILTDCCLSPEADPGLSSSSSASAPASTTSSSISIPRIKAVAPRLGSRISMWVDRAVYECKELRDRIRHGPSRGRGPAPVLTPEQAALARALEDEVFTLAETLPVPLPTTAVAGPKPPRRRSRLAAFLRKMVAALKAALLLKSAAASAPATAATITTDATAGATAAAPIEPTPSLPVSLHASTGGSDGIDGSARSVAGAASVALEVMIDNEQARRVWAQSCPAANGPGSRIDSSSRQPSASSCETADGYSSGNGGRSSSLSALPYSASTSASPSPLLGSAQPSADFPTTYAWLEPQPASPAGGSSSDDEADRSNNEDTSNYAQLAVHASSSSSSAPSDSEADEEAGQRRRRYRQGRLAGGGKSDCGTARVSGWLATSRASSSRARRQQQQQHRQQQQQQALVVAAGYQLVKLARPPATAAAYNGLVG